MLYIHNLIVVKPEAAAHVAVDLQCWYTVSSIQLQYNTIVKAYMNMHTNITERHTHTHKYTVRVPDTCPPPSATSQSL